MPQVTYVIPCLNEAERLMPLEFLKLLASSPGIRLLFIDDGSDDGTRDRLAELKTQGQGRIDFIALERNSGKAEAVRQGFLHALRISSVTESDWIGYLDADLATDAQEAARLIAVAMNDERRPQVVLASRVALLGCQIQRKAWRHYLGRVFATFASIVLNLRVYDTQCGAKLFRVTAVFRAAVERSFQSRWAFDVELLGRLLKPFHRMQGYQEKDFLEVPLMRWDDVRGSKMSLKAMFKAGCDLVRLYFFLRRSSKK